MDDSKVPTELTVYAVRNESGKWWNTCSSHSRSGWVDDISDAKIYVKLSSARSKITAIANCYPDKPIPELVEFVATVVRVVDQKERVAQSRQKKEIEERLREEANAKWRLRCAEENLQRAQREIERLKSSL